MNEVNLEKYCQGRRTAKKGLTQNFNAKRNRNRARSIEVFIEKNKNVFQ